MNAFEVIVNDQLVSVVLPKDNLVSQYKQDTESDDPPTVSLTLEEVKSLDAYYRDGKIASPESGDGEPYKSPLRRAMEYMNVEESFNWDYPIHYIPIKLRERWCVLSNTYDPLITVTKKLMKEARENIPSFDHEKCIESSFKPIRPSKLHYLKFHPWMKPFKYVNQINRMTDKGGAVIAGGSIWCRMTCQTVYDYDVFFYDVDTSTARKMMDFITCKKYCKTVYRSKYAVTCEIRGCIVQFILRIYNSIQDILCNFDIDSCRMAWRDDTIYTVESGLYALTTMTNVLCFDNASLSFEYRLSKYVLRGFSVYIPGFDKSRIQDPTDIDPKSLSGLSLLLYNTKANTFIINNVDPLENYTPMEGTQTITENSCYIMKIQNHIIAVGRATMDFSGPCLKETSELPTFDYDMTPIIREMEKSHNLVSCIPDKMSFTNEPFNDKKFKTMRDIKKWYEGVLYV